MSNIKNKLDNFFQYIAPFLLAFLLFSIGLTAGLGYESFSSYLIFGTILLFVITCAYIIFGLLIFVIRHLKKDRIGGI